MSKSSLDRARAKHHDLVREHGKICERENKLLEQLVRANARKLKAQKAIVRSQKRIDKLTAAAIHTAGPTASVVSSLLHQMSYKANTAESLNDEPLILA